MVSYDLIILTRKKSRWSSNAIVLFGSAAYTYVKWQEMSANRVVSLANKPADRRPLMSTKPDDDEDA